MKDFSKDLVLLLSQKQKAIDLIPDGNYEVKVSVGKENSSMELSNSTVVVAKFNIGSSRCGTLAPDWSGADGNTKAVPHIEYFAKMLGELLSETMEEQHLN